MSPPAFRATFPGVSYQLGNVCTVACLFHVKSLKLRLLQMISSASAQIEATAGERWKTTIIKNGVLTVVPDYAKVFIIFANTLFIYSVIFFFFFNQVQGLLIGVVAAFVIFITTIGPEYVLSFTSCGLFFR